MYSSKTYWTCGMTIRHVFKGIFEWRIKTSEIFVPILLKTGRMRTNHQYPVKWISLPTETAYCLISSHNCCDFCLDVLHCESLLKLFRPPWEISIQEIPQEPLQVSASRLWWSDTGMEKWKRFVGFFLLQREHCWSLQVLPSCIRNTVIQLRRCSGVSLGSGFRQLHVGPEDWSPPHAFPSVHPSMHASRKSLCCHWSYVSSH